MLYEADLPSDSSSPVQVEIHTHTATHRYSVLTAEQVIFYCLRYQPDHHLTVVQQVHQKTRTSPPPPSCHTCPQKKHSPLVQENRL